MTALLRWTDHPLADVGVAVICAMADKYDPAELTLEDLESAGNEIKRAYDDGIMVAYLSCVFTNNAPYTNPTMKNETREAAKARALFPLRGKSDEGVEGLRCIFSGEPATHLLDRADMPMLTGRGVLNFFAANVGALPVAGPYLLALQAVALGGRRSEGKLLVVHSDSHDWTLRFAQKYLADNRRLIGLVRSNSLPSYEGPEEVLTREIASFDASTRRPKYPDAKAPYSLVMSDLVAISAERSAGPEHDEFNSITVYHLSNSGQGPSLSIEHIPGSFVRFVSKLHGPKYAAEWSRLVARGWQADKDAHLLQAPTKRGQSKPVSPRPNGPGRSRNELYNDLVPIFDAGVIDWRAATRFIRRHLLGSPKNSFVDTRKPLDSAPKLDAEDTHSIKWELTALFLIEVLGMNQERVKQIKAFADQLAKVINEFNDKRLFRTIVFADREYFYRLGLAKAQRQYAADRKKLLFSFGDFADVFLAEVIDDQTPWSMVRDLISIRVVEQLFEGDRNFFSRPENKDALNPPEGESDEGERH